MGGPQRCLGGWVVFFSFFFFSRTPPTFFHKIGNKNWAVFCSTSVFFFGDRFVVSQKKNPKNTPFLPFFFFFFFFGRKWFLFRFLFFIFLGGVVFLEWGPVSGYLFFFSFRFCYFFWLSNPLWSFGPVVSNKPPPQVNQPKNLPPPPSAVGPFVLFYFFGLVFSRGRGCVFFSFFFCVNRFFFSWPRGGGLFFTFFFFFFFFFPFSQFGKNPRFFFFGFCGGGGGGVCGWGGEFCFGLGFTPLSLEPGPLFF